MAIPWSSIALDVKCCNGISVASGTCPSAQAKWMQPEYFSSIKYRMVAGKRFGQSEWSVSRRFGSHMVEVDFEVKF